MILDRIIAAKRDEVARGKQERPLDALKEAIASLPEPRNFRQAVGRAGAIIAEVKRRSPSKGVLCGNFYPARIAREYQRHGAAAVSVLTDALFFGGSNMDLAQVKEAVALPVLRKEFIIAPWQIYEARAIGADAILLIVACLTAEELAEYRELAATLGLAALVEVHDRRELEIALEAGAEIIGINNRNLKTFKTDIGTSAALAPLIPPDRIAVSESGIRTRREIETLLEAGVRAFLIGETLMAAPDRGAKLAELLGS